MLLLQKIGSPVWMPPRVSTNCGTVDTDLTRSDRLDTLKACTGGFMQSYDSCDTHARWRVRKRCSHHPRVCFVSVAATLPQENAPECPQNEWRDQSQHALVLVYGAFGFRSTQH